MAKTITIDDVKTLHTHMKNDLKDMVKEIKDYEAEGCDPFDIECDENFNKGYQEAINDLGKLIGRKPTYIAGHRI